MRVTELTIEFLFKIEGCSIEHFKTTKMVIDIPEKIEEEQKDLAIFPIALIIASIIGMSIVKRKWR